MKLLFINVLCCVHFRLKDVLNNLAPDEHLVLSCDTEHE